MNNFFGSKRVKRIIASAMTVMMIVATPMTGMAATAQDMAALKANVAEAKQNLAKANEVVEVVKSQVEEARRVAQGVTDETKATQANEILEAFKDTYEKAVWVAKVHETKLTEAEAALKGVKDAAQYNRSQENKAQPQADPNSTALNLANQAFSGMVLDPGHKVNISVLGKDGSSTATLGDAAILIYNQIMNKSANRISYSDVQEGSSVANAVGLMGAYGYYPIKGAVAVTGRYVTRAELAFMLSPFFSAGIEPANYADVPKNSAYYPYIAKATEYGWIDGYPDKTFRPNNTMTVGEVATAINKAIGYSGDDEIDTYVNNVLSTITNASMDRETKLHVCYNWTRDSFTYLKRHYYEIGDRGWNQQEGKVMFQTQRGNCYCYTSVFYYLARRLGYNARSISGVVGHKRSPHGWVEIDEGGTTYIYDTELEMAYKKKGKIYNFYRMPYSAVPWPYVKR